MPELPEVETIRRDLAQYILGKTIERVEVYDQKISPQEKGLSLCLLGKSFQAIDRRGKLLWLTVDSDAFLLIHLKMTGQLLYRETKILCGGGHSLKSVDDYSDRFLRVLVRFSDGGELLFKDMRRFGFLRLVDQKEKERVLSTFGIEPMTSTYTLSAFLRVIDKKRVTVKTFLLNQRWIAGVGNIYADEACFLAKVLPWRQVSSLSLKETEKLFRGVEETLRIAVENRGTTFRNFVDGQGKEGKNAEFLRVFGRQGQDCVFCAAPIVKTRHAGRGTHYCPACQK